MAVPKRRTSHARQGNRRSHHAKKPIAFAYCARCGETVKPHIVCWHCGWSSVQNRELVQIDAPAEE